MIEGLKYRVSKIQGKIEAKKIASEFKDQSLRTPPVFILGAPRTGSTILYQLLSSQGDFFYFNNYLAKNHQTPAKALKTFASKGGQFKHDSFNSKFGETSGDNAPSEAGYFWYRWIPEGHHELKKSDLSKDDLDQISSYFKFFESQSQLPILIKNLNMGLRMDLIRSIHPQARIIHIVRNTLDNSRSILKGRIKYGNSEDFWFGSKPNEWQDWQNGSVAEQIVGQIEWMNNSILKGAKQLGDECYLRIRYEDLVKDTDSTIKEIKNFLKNGNIEIEHGFPSLSKESQNEEQLELSDFDKEVIELVKSKGTESNTLYL